MPIELKEMLRAEIIEVQTDHHSLEWLDWLNGDNARLTRWSLVLQCFNFIDIHRPGKASTNANALSRPISIQSHQFDARKRRRRVSPPLLFVNCRSYFYNTLVGLLIELLGSIT